MIYCHVRSTCHHIFFSRNDFPQVQYIKKSKSTTMKLFWVVFEPRKQMEPHKEKLKDAEEAAAGWEHTSE